MESGSIFQIVQARARADSGAIAVEYKVLAFYSLRLNSGYSSSEQSARYARLLRILFQFINCMKKHFDHTI